jgi:hypothetical protein
MEGTTVMIAQSRILICSNDVFGVFAKTSEAIAAALRRLGAQVWVSDTTYLRSARLIFSQSDDRAELDRIRDVARAGWGQWIEDQQIDTVIGLDLAWLWDENFFFDQPTVHQVISVWFDDLLAACQSPWNVTFGQGEDRFREAVRHPKVLHAFYGRAQCQDAMALDIVHHCLSYLAADAALLDVTGAPQFKERAAFIGNPGYRHAPPSRIQGAIERGAELTEVRRAMLDVLLGGGAQVIENWCRSEPEVRDFLRSAMELKIATPDAPALVALAAVGENYPRAFEFLNASGGMLHAGLMVQLVNAYDRSVSVIRLHRAGLLDIYSNQEEWKMFGVEAGPTFTPMELGSAYRKYAVHFNAANSIRGATANEKIFEIAASGRVSVNLDSLDIRAVFEPGVEILTCQTLAELEETVRTLLKDPERALHMGKAARARVAREHLWEHRAARWWKIFEAERRSSE